MNEIIARIESLMEQDDRQHHPDCDGEPCRCAELMSCDKAMAADAANDYARENI